MNEQGTYLDNVAPQKIAPMPGKIPGAVAEAFIYRVPINTWPQIDHSGH